MKPIIGVIRKRVKAGITIPAAPNITMASMKAGLSSGLCMGGLYIRSMLFVSSLH